MNHSIWYKQRYAPAYSKQRGAFKKEAERYTDLNEIRKQRRIKNLANAVLVFNEHGVLYEVRSHVWLVTIRGELLYFYPSTNKWRPKGGKVTFNARSAADFIGKVLKFQNHHG